jgi:hypothetical protein
MERKSFSKSDNSFVEGSMTTEALSEARTFLEVLHDAEFQGRKDTDGAARYRLATRLGIKENYLFRLQYRAEEMKDVAGEVYRRLKLAHDQFCERNEAAAERHKTDRLELKAIRHAVTDKPAQAGRRANDARN